MWDSTMDERMIYDSFKAMCVVMMELDIEVIGGNGIMVVVRRFEVLTPFTLSFMNIFHVLFYVRYTTKWVMLDA